MKQRPIYDCEATQDALLQHQRVKEARVLEIDKTTMFANASGKKILTKHRREGLEERVRLWLERIAQEVEEELREKLGEFGKAPSIVAALAPDRIVKAVKERIKQRLIGSSVTNSEARLMKESGKNSANLGIQQKSPKKAKKFYCSTNCCTALICPTSCHLRLKE